MIIVGIRLLCLRFWFWFWLEMSGGSGRNIRSLRVKRIALVLVAILRLARREEKREHRVLCLLRVHRSLLGLIIRLVSGGILGVGNSGKMPELVLVISGFKQHGIADLLLLVPAITLYSFPHN